MSVHMILCLVIFVLTIASFLWGKISMGLTALLSMVLLVLTGCIDITTALSGFSNSNTIIMACMFIISAGFSKTQMVAKMSRGVAKAAKGSFTRVLTGYIIVTFLIAQIVPSAMAVFSIVFPLALGVCDEMKVSPSKIMFSIGIVAISTVTALPIGAGAVYPAQYNGLLENLGAGAYQFKFWDVGLARLPGVIAVMLYAILLAPKFAPEKPVIETREVKPVGAAGTVKLSPVQEVVKAAAEMQDCTVQTRAMGHAAALTCDWPLSARIERICKDELGLRVTRVGSLGGGSEDFSCMAQRVQQQGGQAAYVGLLTACPAANHNDHFDFDEQALANGVAMFAAVTTSLLA